MPKAVLAALGGAVLVLSGACSTDSGEFAAVSSVAREDPVPPEVAAAAHDWPLPGRDHANTRSVPDSPITSDTVDQLAAVWPLILGDRLIVQSLDSAVRVMDRIGLRMLAARRSPTVG